MNNKCTKRITSIGGSALIEGIMMRGPKNTALAVRKADGSIYKEDIEFNSIAKKCSIFRWPIIRGLIGFIDSMRLSYKSLMISADKAIEDTGEVEEPSKFEKWLTDKLGDKLTSVIMVIAAILVVTYIVRM